jgi:hypothetical protein
LVSLGTNSTKQTAIYIENSQKISKLNDTDHRLEQIVDKFLKNVTIGLYSEYEKNREKLEKLEQNANNEKQKGFLFMYYFFISTAIFIVILLLVDKELAVMFIGSAAMISLFFGLTAPLVMIGITKALPVIGVTTLSFDTKTIISTIQKLYNHKEYLIASVVLIVSILIPFLKTLVLLIYGLLKENGTGKNLVSFINKLGKWSMADVFIVSFLVVFFSTKQDINSTLKIEVGLYFFLGYVLLSMLGSSLIKENPQTS